MAIRKQPLRGLSRELSLYGEQAGLSVLRAISVAAVGLPRDPDVEDLEALRDFAASAISEVVMAYGPTVATATLSAWDEVTGGKASASSASVAERALTDVRDLADRKARWAIGEVMGGRADPAWFARKCSEAAWKGVNEVHLSALGQAASSRPGIKWARVPSGSDTCPFCLMLASRGFVYSSAQTAGGHYHPHCDCRVVAGNDGKTHVEGYKQDGMEARVAACASTLGLPDAFDADGEPIPEVLAEVATRDPKWLLDGTVPPVTYESDNLKQETAKERAHEARTAKRLARHGVRAHFVVDSVVKVDPETGLERRIGLADLDNGYELKTLVEAGSANTIEGYLKSASKKKNAVAVVFDNMENRLMSDARLEEILSNTRRFKRGRIYVITKDDGYVRINRKRASDDT